MLFQDEYRRPLFVGRDLLGKQQQFANPDTMTPILSSSAKGNQVAEHSSSPLSPGLNAPTRDAPPLAAHEHAIENTIEKAIAPADGTIPAGGDRKYYRGYPAILLARSGPPPPPQLKPIPDTKTVRAVGKRHAILDV